LALTEDSESHTEADTCIFETFLAVALKIWWELPSLACKADTRRPVVTVRRKCRIISWAVFKNEKGEIYFVTWIHKSHMLLTNFGLLGTWTSLRTSLWRKKRLKEISCSSRCKFPYLQQFCEQLSLNSAVWRTEEYDIATHATFLDA
jgi:hypothetical protein